MTLVAAEWKPTISSGNSENIVAINNRLSVEARLNLLIFNMPLDHNVLYQALYIDNLKQLVLINVIIIRTGILKQYLNVYILI